MIKLFTFFMTILVTPSFFSNPLAASSQTTYPIFDLQAAEDLTSSVRFYEIKASKSGQFSERSFIELVDSLPLESDKLIIFDLRDDCHGLINGMPVYWRDECLCCEQWRVKEALDFGHVWIEGKDQINPLDQVVSQALTERELVESFGHFYLRVPMTDGDLPNDLFVDEFVQFIQYASSNHWIHFHDRTGGEKASTFLVLSDILKNGRQTNLEDILAKHELMSEADLARFISEEQRLNHIQEKLDFISDFYAYCNEVPDFSTPWSEWIASQYPFASIYANKHSSQRKISLVDQLLCGWQAGACFEWDSQGNCISREWIYIEDNKGNFIEVEGQQGNGKKRVIIHGGDGKNKGGNGRR